LAQPAVHFGASDVVRRLDHNGNRKEIKFEPSIKQFEEWHAPLLG